MTQPSNNELKNLQLREKIIGLGESSIRKSYYPELQNRLAELERFVTLLNQSTNAIFLIRIPDGQIEDVTNPAITQLGYTREQLLSMDLFSLLDAETMRAFHEYLGIEEEVRPDHLTWISQVTRLDGSTIPMEIVFSPVIFDGIHYAIVAAQNIIKRVEANRKVQDQMTHLNALHEIDLAITSAVDMPTMMNRVLNQIVTSLKVDAACILSMDPDAEFHYLAWQGFRKGPLAGILPSHMQEGCMARRAMNELIFIPDFPEMRAVFCDSRVPAGEDFQLYIALPLVARGQLKGVLEIFHRSQRDTSPEWLHYLESYAAQAAIALDNSQMMLDLQRSNQELHQAYDATLEGWALALELRERETGQHTKRVQSLTCMLARAAGISDRDLVQIQRGALLHDIGKMGIPDQILLKPGPLDDDEWKIMRLHPEYAYNMLSPISFLQPCLDIPYCHHEKWDGSGYPRGLRGLDIPLSARLFCVADVWDALLSDRPYRKAWPRERVIEYMKSESGRHFDPDILKLFLEQIIQPQK